MSANPLQDLVLVLLVRVAEVPIPRSPVALAALAKVVAPLLRAPDDVPFLVVAVAAVVLRGVARRPIVGKVHNAPFAFCFRAVGLQPLVEGALAGDDDRCSRLLEKFALCTSGKAGNVAAVVRAFSPAVRQLVRLVVVTLLV